MNESHRIILYGTSIFVAAIESALSALGIGEVLALTPRTSDAIAQITALKPSVVIIEKVGRNQELARSILQRGFPVIILDEAQRKIAVQAGSLLSEEKFIEAEIGELTQVIKQILTDKWSRARPDQSSATID